MPSRATRDLVLILLPWLALPVMAWALLAARGALPADVAIHFGLDGAPDRWVGRESFLTFALVLLAAVLALFSTRSLRARAAGRLAPMLVSQYILVAVVCGAIWQVVRFNRDGERVSVGVLLAGVAAALAASAFARRRLRPGR